MKVILPIHGDKSFKAAKDIMREVNNIDEINLSAIFHNIASGPQRSVLNMLKAFGVVVGSVPKEQEKRIAFIREKLENKSRFIDGINDSINNSKAKYVIIYPVNSYSALALLGHNAKENRYGFIVIRAGKSNLNLQSIDYPKDSINFIKAIIKLKGG